MDGATTRSATARWALSFPRNSAHEESDRRDYDLRRAARLRRTAAPAHPQTLHTIEAMIDEATQADPLDVNDPMAVFEFVLAALPDRVRVLPTENYYYFRFMHRGVPYEGNIRLSVRDRDQGVVHFVYGRRAQDWTAEQRMRIHAFGDAQGVSVEKAGALEYRIAFRNRAVTFALNDLSEARPPEGLVRASETLIGPLFDESALRFFLVFNRRLSVFHYILDETRPVPDALARLDGSERIVIGQRTGFAFFLDGNRKVLIGVSERASRLNTLYDGPFDQLPDNFIADDTLRDAILSTEPELKGRMDRYGHIDGLADRFLIHPYMLYRDVADLRVFDRCVVKVPQARRPLCFVISDGQAQKRRPLPAALNGGR